MHASSYPSVSGYRIKDHKSDEMSMMSQLTRPKMQKKKQQTSSQPFQEAWIQPISKAHRTMIQLVRKMKKSLYLYNYPGITHKYSCLAWVTNANIG
jgi:hypothetical protein